MHFDFVLAARVIYNKNPIYFPQIGTAYAYYIGICVPHIIYIYCIMFRTETVSAASCLGWITS